MEKTPTPSPEPAAPAGSTGDRPTPPAGRHHLTLVENKPDLFEALAAQRDPIDQRVSQIQSAGNSATWAEIGISIVAFLALLIFLFALNDGMIL